MTSTFNSNVDIIVLKWRSCKFAVSFELSIGRHENKITGVEHFALHHNMKGRKAGSTEALKYAQPTHSVNDNKEH